jgi:hypothetical protein
MANDLTNILAAADAGEPVASIAAAHSLPPGRVYAILREHRPSRPRTPRQRTSAVPDKIRFLVKQGMAPGRVAVVLGCSRAYVYRALSGSENNA